MTAGHPAHRWWILAVIALAQLMIVLEPANTLFAV
jgi:hypothetical protein